MRWCRDLSDIIAEKSIQCGRGQRAGRIIFMNIMISIRNILTWPVIQLSILAALLVFAYPPFPFGFLAWVIPALVLAVLDGRSVKDSFQYGWWFGFCMHLGLVNWTAPVTVPGTIALAVILGIYVAVVFAAYAYLRRTFGRYAIWLWPILWVAHEYLRGLGVLGFPWTNLSYTQTDYTRIIQFAEITGDLGISLWVAFLNVILYGLWASRAPKQIKLGLIGAIAAMIVLPFLYGMGEISRLENEEQRTVTASVLQGDIDTWQKWDSTFAHFSYASYYGLTRLAAEQATDLIVWPETATPGFLRADIRRLREVQALSRATQVPLLLGTLEYRVVGPSQYIYYNAAHQVVDGRLGPRYHAKMQLVPLGEWIPFSDRVKILKNIHVGQADYTAGDEYVVFDHPRGPYAVLICFESAFPDLVRNFVRGGARYLVNITNDGWYGLTPGPYQHARMCVMRAIENRVPIVRSANSGISMFVDRTGQILNASKLYFTDLRTETLFTGTKTTFFTRHGMWLGNSCMWLTFAALAVAGIISMTGRLRNRNLRKSGEAGKD